MNPQQLPLYRMADGVESACSNVYNVDAARGKAGEQCRFPRVQPGDNVVLANLEGPGVITRLWLTFDWPGRQPYPDSMLRNRALRLRITWDDAKTPAVDVPVGDFFCHPLCYDLPLENAWFADPTGRSSLCFIPMPFRSRARIELINEFDQPVTAFHDIRLLRVPELDADDAYFHACFNRTPATKPGLLHDVLPRVQGRGRYLGTHLAIIADRHNPLHWHDSNLRFFLDDDGQYPSIMAASLDDFGGSSWAYDQHYQHQDSGLILARNFPTGGGHLGMYFYHRRDPFYFSQSCHVTIRPTVGMTGDALLALTEEHPGIVERLGLPCTLQNVRQRLAANKDVWVDSGRLDDITTVSLYYLDQPDGKHDLASHASRTAPAWQWPNDQAHAYWRP